MLPFSILTKTQEHGGDFLTSSHLFLKKFVWEAKASSAGWNGDFIGFVWSMRFEVWFFSNRFSVMWIVGMSTYLRVKDNTDESLSSLDFH